MRGGAAYSARSYAKGIVPRYGNMKFKAVFQCAADGSGIINHGFRMTTPDTFDGSNSVTDWTSAANLYDEYRVRGLKLKFVPQRPNDPTIATVTPSNAVLYQPVYVFADYDSVGLSPTVASCVGYDNLRIKDLTRPWKAYYRIPKMANYGSSTISRPGWMDTASTTTTGAVYMHAESVTPGLQYGKVILTYYVTFHNRK